MYKFSKQHLIFAFYVCGFHSKKSNFYLLRFDVFV